MTFKEHLQDFLTNFPEEDKLRAETLRLCMETMPDETFPIVAFLVSALNNKHTATKDEVAMYLTDVMSDRQAELFTMPYSVLSMYDFDIEKADQAIREMV